MGIMQAFNEKQCCSFLPIYKERNPPARRGFLCISCVYNTALLVPAHRCYMEGSSPFNYLLIEAMAPAATVRPPSRIVNFVPSSIAIGAIS